MAKKPEKPSKAVKPAVKVTPKAAAKSAQAKVTAPAKPVVKAAVKTAPATKPVAKAAPEKKVAVKAPATKAKKNAEATAPARGPGRPRKDGSADYAVQARKLRALLDSLASGQELSEAALLAAISGQGFEVHPRTLAREIDRLSIIGFPVVRIQGPEGISYQLPEDEVIAEAVSGLEAVRKALKKEGSAQEKAVSAVVKLLKD